MQSHIDGRQYGDCRGVVGRHHTTKCSGTQIQACRSKQVRVAPITLLSMVRLFWGTQGTLWPLLSEPMAGGMAPGPGSPPLPDSSRWWGFGKHRQLAPVGGQRCPARSGRRGARAWSGGGLARSPLWPGCTSPWTSPPTQRSSPGESPSRSRPLRRQSGQLSPASSLPAGAMGTVTGQAGRVSAPQKRNSGAHQEV